MTQDQIVYVPTPVSELPENRECYYHTNGYDDVAYCHNDGTWTVEGQKARITHWLKPVLLSSLLAEKDREISILEENAIAYDKQVLEKKAEIDELKAVLQLLVELKRVKDTEGKTEFYERNQPLAWERARNLLKH